MIENVARPNCRGSWALGTACGKCPRCEATRPAIAAMQQAQEPVAWRDLEAAAKKHGLSYRSPDNLAAFLADIAPLYAHPPVQWQGIESAPRDGTRFLAFGRNGVRLVWLAFIDALNHPVWTDGDLDYYTLSHWMPLPTPPNGGSDAE